MFPQPTLHSHGSLNTQAILRIVTRIASPAQAELHASTPVLTHGASIDKRRAEEGKLDISMIFIERADGVARLTVHIRECEAKALLEHAAVAAFKAITNLPAVSSPRRSDFRRDKSQVAIQRKGVFHFLFHRKVILSLKHHLLRTLTLPVLLCRDAPSQYC